MSVGMFEISIPIGSIKSYLFLHSTWSDIISIPIGSIKSYQQILLLHQLQYFNSYWFN